MTDTGLIGVAPSRPMAGCGSAEPLAGIPIRTIVATLVADPTRYLARSAAIVDDRATGERFFFGGASVHSDPETACWGSRLEVVERVWALPALHRKLEQFPWQDYFDPGVQGTVAASDVLLSNKRPMNASEENVSLAPSRGAVGLGLASSLELAKRHGLQEAIERHLRTTSWYGRRGLCHIGEAQRLMANYELRRYGVNGIAVPFCLSVITGTGARSVFYAGSAVRDTFEHAQRKADDEALMLLDNHLANRTGLANTADARAQFLRLTGSDAIRTAAYLATRVTGHAAVWTGETSDRRLVQEVLGAESNVRFSVIMRRAGLVLVRVFSSQLTCERLERPRHGASISDPFC